uniref:Lipocalin n=1 Tax=Rhipicephalus zambeziensis TaxID=60191 RepID=A0A224YKA3_9ACAR
MNYWRLLAVICLPIMVSPLLPSGDENCTTPGDYDYYDTDDEIDTLADQADKKPKTKVSSEIFPDITQFLNTTEKIWVYNSTKTSNDTCMVDVINHTSMINVYMTRYYFSEGMIHHRTSEVYFEIHPQFQSATKTYNEMQIDHPGFGKPYETLVHLGEKNDCGVFYINYHHNEIPSPHDWYELRVWNSSLEAGPDKKCVEMYEAISRNDNTTFSYTPACQCILLQGA